MNQSGLPTAGNKIPEVTEQLPHLPFEVRRTARVIADVIGVTDWASGKNPTTIAASCVYLADLVHNRDDRLSQMVFDDLDIATHVGIRGQYREIPGLFLDHADEDDIERLGNDSEQAFVVETLEHLREKKEDGYALDAIEWRPDEEGDLSADE